MKTITVTQTSDNVLTFTSKVKGRKIRKDYHMTLLGRAITNFKKLIEKEEMR